MWYHGGIVCTGETYKSHLRLTFAQRAILPDSNWLFNSGLDGGTLRAIVIQGGDEIDAEPLKSLIWAAVTLNASSIHQ